MLSMLCTQIFMLAQNEEEKGLTVLGLALFAGLMLFLLIDTFAKNKYIPKKSPLRGFIVFLMLISLIAVFLLIIYYK